MYRLFTLGLFTVATLLPAADTKDVHKTVPLTVGGTVSLATHKGSIRISAWDRPDVEINAVIQEEPGTTMNRRAFDATEIVIDSAPDSVQIRTKYPEWESCCSDNDSYPEVKYEIHMPRTAHLRVRDHRSESEISGIAGGLDLVTHRGSVHVTGLSGALKLATHRGEVRIAFASFNANSSIETYRGNVELSLPKDSKFDIRTQTEKHATFQSDFSMTMRAGTIKGNGSNLQAAVNGGGPELRVQSYRGQIHIRTL